MFREIETLSGAEGDQRLRDMSQEFWTKHAYGTDDPDRVVMCVSLKAERDGAVVWHKTYVMDAWGDAASTAMARLVSVPVSMAVSAVLENQIPAGVSAAPSDPDLVKGWLNRINSLAQHLTIIDHQ